MLCSVVLSGNLEVLGGRVQEVYVPLIFYLCYCWFSEVVIRVVCLVWTLCHHGLTNLNVRLPECFHYGNSGATVEKPTIPPSLQSHTETRKIGIIG